MTTFVTNNKTINYDIIPTKIDAIKITSINIDKIKINDNGKMLTSM